MGSHENVKKSSPGQSPPFFQDRNAAGIALAARLSDTLDAAATEDALVLGAVRGGMPVAYEIARALDLPLGVLVVRKLRAEGKDDIPMGAVAPGRARYINTSLVERFAIPIDFLEAAISREEGELNRLLTAFHHDRPLNRIEGRTILLVDDGIVSGSTLSAALLSLQKAGAKKVIVAVPVCSTEGRNVVSERADSVISLETFGPGTSLPAAYVDFVEITESDVHDYLGRGKPDPPVDDPAGITRQGSP